MRSSAHPQPTAGASPATRARQITLAVLLATVASLLGGCVYLRLLELKKQLSAFDRHFTVSTDPGVRLDFKTPLLLPGDIRWLGGEPLRQERTGAQEHWHVRWTKDPAPNVREMHRYDIEVDLTFTRGKLTALAVDERFFGVMPKDMLLNALRALGSAQIDRSQREAQADTPGLLPSGPGVAAFTQATVEQQLGFPTERTVTANEVRSLYRFRSAVPGSRLRPLELTITADFAGALQHLKVKLPTGAINLRLAEGK